MLLFYTDTITERLNYICHFILKEQLGIDYVITTNPADCNHSNHHLIYYSKQSPKIDNFHIKPQGLLFEKEVRLQHIDCYEVDGYKAFFFTNSIDFPFDIFAAAFFLLSRYEEYLPHEKDIYGRYAHDQSVAFKHDFLHLPLVNIWLADFKKALILKFPDLKCKTQVFKSILTYDIDIAWSYKNKGIIRNIGGFLVKPSLERLLVLLQLKKDPFDAYKYLDKIHDQIHQKVIYFFLVADEISRYDKNISPKNNPMQQLIRQHANKYCIGIHPSWKSNKNLATLRKEINQLQEIISVPTVHARQHYIQFTLPETFERLQEAGIKKEYSMGYGSINGFRASFAGSYYWYNLAKEKITSLQLFPFCYMDANSYYEQKQNPSEGKKELEALVEQCKRYDGLFISIFHNNFLGEDKKFSGWKEMYAQFISQLQ
jgi:hypothetical protein